MQPSNRDGLLTLRAALILALATVVALIATALTWVHSGSWATAALAGGGAWAAAVFLFDFMIKSETPSRTSLR